MKGSSALEPIILLLYHAPKGVQSIPGLQMQMFHSLSVQCFSHSPIFCSDMISICLIAFPIFWDLSAMVAFSTAAGGSHLPHILC